MSNPTVACGIRNRTDSETEADEAAARDDDREKRRHQRQNAFGSRVFFLESSRTSANALARKFRTGIAMFIFWPRQSQVHRRPKPSRRPAALQKTRAACPFLNARRQHKARQEHEDQGARETKRVQMEDVFEKINAAVP
ncbi:MAG: hypothetical protein ACR2II_00415 [Chthoniobacterales bacterium]